MCNIVTKKDFKCPCNFIFNNNDSRYIIFIGFLYLPDSLYIESIIYLFYLFVSGCNKNNRQVQIRWRQLKENFQRNSNPHETSTSSHHKTVPGECWLWICQHLFKCFHYRTNPFERSIHFNWVEFNIFYCSTSARNC